LEVVNASVHFVPVPAEISLAEDALRRVLLRHESIEEISREAGRKKMLAKLLNHMKCDNWASSEIKNGISLFSKQVTLYQRFE
jgi:hypothetical protein